MCFSTNKRKHHLGWRAPADRGCGCGGCRVARASYTAATIFFVRQHLIGVSHPVFVQIPHLFRDQPIAEGALRPAASQSRFFLPRLGAAPSGRSRSWLSSQIASSASRSR